MTDPYLNNSDGSAVSSAVAASWRGDSLRRERGSSFPEKKKSAGSVFVSVEINVGAAGCRDVFP